MGEEASGQAAVPYQRRPGGRHLEFLGGVGPMKARPAGRRSPRGVTIRAPAGGPAARLGRQARGVAREEPPDHPLRPDGRQLLSSPAGGDRIGEPR